MISSSKKLSAIEKHPEGSIEMQKKRGRQRSYPMPNKAKMPSDAAASKPSIDNTAMLPFSISAVFNCRSQAMLMLRAQMRLRSGQPTSNRIDRKIYSILSFLIGNSCVSRWGAIEIIGSCAEQGDPIVGIRPCRPVRKRGLQLLSMPQMHFYTRSNLSRARPVSKNQESWMQWLYLRTSICLNPNQIDLATTEQTIYTIWAIGCWQAIWYSLSAFESLIAGANGLAGCGDERLTHRETSSFESWRPATRVITGTIWKPGKHIRIRDRNMSCKSSKKRFNHDIEWQNVTDISRPQ